MKRSKELEIKTDIMRNIETCLDSYLQFYCGYELDCLTGELVVGDTTDTERAETAIELFTKAMNAIEK